MVSSTEGTQRHGYNTAFGGGRIDNLSEFPGTGRNAASGRYQITAGAFSDAQDALGLDDFSPHSQDLAAAWLLHSKAVLPYLKIGDFAGALDPASRAWSSLPKGEGSWNVGRYDNTRYGFQKAHDFAAVQSMYKDALQSRRPDVQYGAGSIGREPSRLRDRCAVRTSRQGFRIPETGQHREIRHLGEA